jgi:hypothetical protein
MNLEELTKIQSEANRRNHLAKVAKVDVDHFASVRKSLAERPLTNIHEFLNKHFYSDTSDRRMLLNNSLNKYLPDICREIELQLEAEARAHSNHAKVLNAQVAAFFNEQETAP